MASNGRSNNETTLDYQHQPNNSNQFIMESRERKRKERLALIKSQILSQLNRRVNNGNVDNQDCSLTTNERNILNEIFVIIKKTPEGTIDVDQFTTNPIIIDKLQGLRSNSWICVKNALSASAGRQLNPLNSTILSRSFLFPSINSSSTSTSSSTLSSNSSSSSIIGHHLFDQSGLSNKSLIDYQNDNATQQHILEQRQRRRQERLIYIQNQILSRLGLTQRANETVPPCKLTDEERALINQLFTKSTSSSITASNANQISNAVFTKIQGFYPSCKLDLTSMDPNRLNNSLSS
uniref:Uncharacterized protein n=2 Tax=Tetranychus urticae TaxID=32264 RepID=T1JVB3_TETUR